MGSSSSFKALCSTPLLDLNVYSSCDFFERTGFGAFDVDDLNFFAFNVLSARAAFKFTI
jgi:hypothetical protein